MRALRFDELGRRVLRGVVRTSEISIARPPEREGRAKPACDPLSTSVATSQPPAFFAGSVAVWGRSHLTRRAPSRVMRYI
jgi:hypothetical protein